MSPTKYRDEVIIRSEVVLQIPVKASPFFKRGCFKARI